ncbi:MAG: 2OG-Fe(II) oxygenase [Rhodospirillaceae bacterium]
MALLLDDGTASHSAAPLWVEHPDAFTLDECALLIGLTATRPHKEAGLVDGQAQVEIRRTLIHWLAEDAETAWVYQRLASIVAQENREKFHFALTGFDEDAQVGRYAEGHFYDWHIDRGGRGTGRSRKLTVSVQLTDPRDYDGGDLELNPDGHPICGPRTRGTAAVFPAYTLHRVAPITRGVRHSLVFWAHGPDFT